MTTKNYIVNHHSEGYGYDPVGNRQTGPKVTDLIGYLKKHLTHEAAFPIFPEKEVLIITQPAKTKSRKNVSRP